MTSSLRSSVNLPLPAFLGGVVAALIALVMLLVPTHLLESAVLDSGIAAVVGAAEPPLGLTARIVLALMLGGGVGAALAFGTFVLGGEQRKRAGTDEATPIPVLRRSDAHPDAPARRPLFATQELGTPFLDVSAPREPVERELPKDLNQPLAAFDPAAIPPMPREPIRPVAPLIRPQGLEPGERLETFPLTPPPVTDEPPLPMPSPARSTEATIQSLLERLEIGIQQREEARRTAAEQPPQTLNDKLVELRRMATQR
jgi:hypothetical protein